MGAFGRDLIRVWGGDIDAYNGDKQKSEPKKTFKVIIAGSRDFQDYDLLREKCDKILENIQEEIWVVSGTAKGADMMGESYARERGYQIVYFPPNWRLYGRGAGPVRNREMAEYADAAIVFMKKEGSIGSQNMIDTAKSKGLKVRVINY